METHAQKTKQSGQGLIEYLILVALIAVGTMGVMRVVGVSLKTRFNSVARSLGADTPGNVPRPVVTESMLKKNDLRNFMHGSRGPGREQQDEIEPE